MKIYMFEAQTLIEEHCITFHLITLLPVIVFKGCTSIRCEC